MMWAVLWNKSTAMAATAHGFHPSSTGKHSLTPLLYAAILGSVAHSQGEVVGGSDRRLVGPCSSRSLEVSLPACLPTPPFKPRGLAKGAVIDTCYSLVINNRSICTTKLYLGLLMVQDVGRSAPGVWTYFQCSYYVLNGVLSKADEYCQPGLL